jgi:hypothetical protein
MDSKTFKLTRAKRERITRQAVRDLAKKMSLEPQLIGSLKRFFKKIAKDAKANYISNNVMLSLTPYRNELTKILFNHYMRVYRNFSSNMRKSSKLYKHYLLAHEIKKDNSVQYTISIDTTRTKTETADINDTVDEMMQDKALQDSLERADKQSGYIIETTEKQLEEAYFEAETNAGEFGDEASAKDIANTATESFELKSTSRPNEIAITETQAVAEKAKYEEANSISSTLHADTTGSIDTGPSEFVNPLEDVDREALSGYTVKYWVTMADDKVREAHLIAEGQVQFADEPFTVMDEELMQPGDTSLGASKANVCNCRCTAVYEYIE